MLRTALRPRWLGLLALAVVLAVLCIIAGRWQWSVAHDVARADAVREVQDQPVEPLGEVMAPHESFPDGGSGQRVSTRGEYTGDQVIVVDRLLDDVEGLWVVERFVVEETRANVAVVRGWIPKGATPPKAPSGTIELLGSLAPKEAPDEGGLPEGRMTSVDIAQLVNTWPGEIYNGFAFAMEEDGTAAAPGLERVPPPLPDTSLNIRNVMYAFQWWIFAAFPLWMWTKMVRQAAHRDDAPARAAVETKEHVA
ncbi:SURF1 family protein [Janibacter sp. GS2]|uniref:SURF1 family protein n=1 Tax=Janibacter sp. GS2 TaxID=3442646 RepID=UPI003EB9D753